MRVWIVYDQNGHWLDQVFYSADCDRDYVRRTLIEHDGYPSHITVLPGR